MPFISHWILHLVQSFFLVGRDGAVRGWVGNAGEHESIAHLVVIQERLVRLVNSSGLNLSGAGGASSSTATVWKIDSCRREEGYTSAAFS
jgi:hypothetical protein